MRNQNSQQRGPEMRNSYLIILRRHLLLSRICEIGKKRWGGGGYLPTIIGGRFPKRRGYLGGKPVKEKGPGVSYRIV